ncbi:uncharacterized protein A4U43_C03F20100 [Asparagus officinalis]|uniref:Uncharacterized protein n=1 Tax=Asparagus officinalis TaxID=4686 RepID=A0A5P1FBJ4_ASPOF|nr:uncharacterized protein A4U43_C03F20100 [Asparagus officinalis]
MLYNIDDDAIEQHAEAVDQMELSQQLSYWKSVTIINQKLRRDDNRKFEDQIAAKRMQITSLSVKVTTLSAQVRGLREKLSEAQCRSLIVYENKKPTTEENEGPLPGEVPPPDTTGIDTKVEDPRPEEVPSPEADKFFEVEE